jgi:hypothetical protein
VNVNGFWLNAILAVITVLVSAAFIWKVPPAWPYSKTVALGGGGALVFDLATSPFYHDWWDGWIQGVAATVAVALAFWFWRSGKRKRATKAIGDKSRRIRAALVRTMRERARRRPQLAPQPI